MTIKSQSEKKHVDMEVEMKNTMYHRVVKLSMKNENMKSVNDIIKK